MIGGGYQGGGMPDLRSGLATIIFAALVLVGLSLALLAADAVGLLDQILRAFG